MKKTALVMAVLLSGSIAMAQKSFSDVLENKKLDKALTVQAPGNLLDEQFQKLEMKRIGLLSFYIMDEGDQDAYSWMGMSEAGGNYIASTLRDMSIDAIKGSFSAEGFELLLPEEYLDTDAKKQAYANYQMEVGPGFKVLLNAVNSIASAGSGMQMSATASGYEFIPFADAAGDYKMGESMAGLTEQLGVDALAVVFIKSRTDKKNTYFVSTGMHILSKNPIEKVPGKKYPGRSYTTGMNVGGLTYAAKPQFTFVDYKKGERIAEDFVGYDQLITKIASKLASTTKQRMAGN
jgi:hypothetical protein